MAYLRTIWDRNPERREPAAMGLAQAPQGDNWLYLVRSLPVLEDSTAREVLRRLATVAQVPDDPEHIRQIILCGLRLKDQAPTTPWPYSNSGRASSWVRSRMTGRPSWRPGRSGLPSRTRICRKPRCRSIRPTTSGSTRSCWSSSRARSPNRRPDQGSRRVQKANCEKCHRFGERGEVMGPDLTALAKRFTRKEILQSILYPSHTISSQYVSQNVLLVDGARSSASWRPALKVRKFCSTRMVRRSPFAKKTSTKSRPSKLSSMPDGCAQGTHPRGNRRPVRLRHHRHDPGCRANNQSKWTGRRRIRRILRLDGRPEGLQIFDELISEISEVQHRVGPMESGLHESEIRSSEIFNPNLPGCLVGACA